MPLKAFFKQSAISAHIACWSVFITYELLVSYSFTGKLGSPFDYFGHYFLNISLFYWNGLVTMEWSLNKNKRSYFLMALLLAAELAGYLALKYLLYLVLIQFRIYSPAQLNNLSTFIIQSAWRALYFIGLSTGWWFSISRIVQRNTILALEKKNLISIVEKESAEKNLLVAENMYLSAQINPHFLFNTLSFIHYKVNNVSADAGDMVIIIADMMRYALKKPEEDNLVNIEEEIEHIENFIRINQLRFKNRLLFNFSYDSNLQGIRVIPLVIMTIVENIFKYGELADPDHPATMSIRYEGTFLKVHVKNRVGRTRHKITHGIGISNATKRMEQQYKENFLLEISADHLTYELNLSIRII